VGRIVVDVAGHVVAEVEDAVEAAQDVVVVEEEEEASKQTSAHNAWFLRATKSCLGPLFSWDQASYEQDMDRGRQSTIRSIREQST